MLRDVRPGRAAGAAAAALVVAWSCTLSPVRLSVLVGVAATAIAALGLDILVARSGQLSLAHAAFLGVGAFTALNVGGHGGPWPLALAAAVGAGAFAATLAGLPSLRIRGLQVAITTLAFQVAAENFLFTRQDFTAADQVLERPALLDSDLRLYLFALGCVAAEQASGEVVRPDGIHAAGCEEVVGRGPHVPRLAIAAHIDHIGIGRVARHVRRDPGTVP